MAEANAVGSVLSCLITRDECLYILLKVLSMENRTGTLVSYEIYPDESAIGYLGEYFHFYIMYRRENEEELAEKRLFIKSVPYRNPAMRAVVDKLGVLQKESALYGRLLNDMRLLSPTIWCAHCYLVKGDLFVIDFVEDLGYAKIPDLSRFFTRAEIDIVLRSLASMHASCLAYESRRKAKITDPFAVVLQEMFVSPHVDGYATGLRAVIEVALRNPLYQTEPFQNFIKNDLATIFAAAYEMVNTSNKYCNVVCQRDVWMGNIFFPVQFNPLRTNVIFVDFQMARYSPPAIDVLMALHLNLRPSYRKLIEEECFLFYYECFRGEMALQGLYAESFMTYATFLQSIKEFTLFGHVYSCIAGTTLRVPGNYLRDIKLTFPAEFFQYMNHDRTQRVIELMQTRPPFYTYMTEAIQDMMEYVLKNCQISPTAPR